MGLGCIRALTKIETAYWRPNSVMASGRGTASRHHFKAGLHVRRKHKHKNKHKPHVNRDDASTSARSFSCACVVPVHTWVAYAYACVVRVNQPLVAKDDFLVVFPDPEFYFLWRLTRAQLAFIVLCLSVCRMIFWADVSFQQSMGGTRRGRTGETAAWPVEGALRNDQGPAPTPPLRGVGSHARISVQRKKHKSATRRSAVSRNDNGYRDRHHRHGILFPLLVIVTIIIIIIVVVVIIIIIIGIITIIIIIIIIVNIIVNIIIITVIIIIILFTLFLLIISIVIVVVVVVVIIVIPSSSSSWPSPQPYQSSSWTSHHRPP